MTPPPADLRRILAATLGVAAAVMLACMVGGRLAGWPWPRALATFDAVVFLLGAGSFLVGILAGKPPVPGPPEGMVVWDAAEGGRAPRCSAELSDPLVSEHPDLRDDQPAHPSETDALGRLRNRAPSLAIAGLLLILWTAAAFSARHPLGRVYGGTTSHTASSL